VLSLQKINQDYESGVLDSSDLETQVEKFLQFYGSLKFKTA